MKPLSEDEQAAHRDVVQVVLSALSGLRLTGVRDEDIEVAKARLENWLAENAGRWVK